MYRTPACFNNISSYIDRFTESRHRRFRPIRVDYCKGCWICYRIHIRNTYCILYQIILPVPFIVKLPKPFQYLLLQFGSNGMTTSPPSCQLITCFSKYLSSIKSLWPHFRVMWHLLYLTPFRFFSFPIFEFFVSVIFWGVHFYFFSRSGTLSRRERHYISTPW